MCWKFDFSVVAISLINYISNFLFGVVTTYISWRYVRLVCLKLKVLGNLLFYFFLVELCLFHLFNPWLLDSIKHSSHPALVSVELSIPSKGLSEEWVQVNISYLKIVIYTLRNMFEESRQLEQWSEGLPHLLHSLRWLLFNLWHSNVKIRFLLLLGDRVSCDVHEQLSLTGAVHDKLECIFSFLWIYHSLETCHVVTFGKLCRLKNIFFCNQSINMTRRRNAVVQRTFFQLPQ